MKELKAIVSGLVQGVFFRASTEREANKLGLSGYVRNLPSGDVEVVAQGDETRLKTLLQWLYKGPPGAKVNNVDFELKDPEKQYSGFRVSY
jgi:acylphosphatase